MFHVVPAGRPDPPYNCTALNKTHHSFIVSCARGFDGGLRQRFSLLVTTIRDSKEQLILNVTSGALPEFTVTGLESGQEYTLMGFAYNEKGWSRGSQPVVVATLMQPNLHEQRRSTGIHLISTLLCTRVTDESSLTPYEAEKMLFVLFRVKNCFFFKLVIICFYIIINTIFNIFTINKLSSYLSAD